MQMIYRGTFDQIVPKRDSKKRSNLVLVNGLWFLTVFIVISLLCPIGFLQVTKARQKTFPSPDPVSTSASFTGIAHLLPKIPFISIRLEMEKAHDFGVDAVYDILFLGCFRSVLIFFFYLPYDPLQDPVYVVVLAIGCYKFLAGGPSAAWDFLLWHCLELKPRIRGVTVLKAYSFVIDF
ncbi:hypothetical protein Cni_G12504 [Canna indica]|uniref:Uncharacterized protein n=1 Tax=Canna indica TaxID=4628 RepID=A0AAQ3K9H5_9LILI|nr:hypothetical protein Cni_G12504 [Canna indica]